jgi:hypothetical protein
MRVDADSVNGETILWPAMRGESVIAAVRRLNLSIPPLASIPHNGAVIHDDLSVPSVCRTGCRAAAAR